MFWNLKRKNCKVRVIILFQKKFKSAFIALPDISILSVHRRQLLLLKFLRIALFFFSYFILVHLFIHFFSNLFCVRWLCLIFLLFSHGFLSLFSLLLFNLFFFQFEFTCFYGFIQGFFQGRQKLFSFNFLRWCDYLAIIAF